MFKGSCLQVVATNGFELAEKNGGGEKSSHSAHLRRPLCHRKDTKRLALETPSWDRLRARRRCGRPEACPTAQLPSYPAPSSLAEKKESPAPRFGDVISAAVARGA